MSDDINETINSVREKLLEKRRKSLLADASREIDIAADHEPGWITAHRQLQILQDIEDDEDKRRPFDGLAMIG